ncbi:MAG TPA: type II secretion system protein [Planctomycetota bacterium]|nr:type II secretion system protein [Planctomycetota bacterium]
MGTHGRDLGYTLLEVMIGTVILVILAMGLASSMGAAFMADAAARHTALSTHACQQVLEELEHLDYGDVLACDGDAMLTPGSVAVKISATEAMVGLILIEVRAARPKEQRTLLELAGMTMQQFRDLQTVIGSEVRVVTYRAGR